MKGTNGQLKCVSILLILLSIPSLEILSQSSMIIHNDAYLTMDNSGGTFIVVNNSSDDAIQTTGSGGNIISEHETNIVKWDIASQTGNYSIPFTTNSGVKIPFQLDVLSAGTGNGSILISTYETTTDNNTPLTSINQNTNDFQGIDISLNMLDRYWITQQNNYSVAPSAAWNFTYDENGNEMGGSNNIDENNLKAYYYDVNQSHWVNSFGTLQTSSNQVNNISTNGWKNAWSLVDPCANYVLSINNVDDVTCIGGLNGAISVTPTGGTPGYDYQWTPNISSTGTANGLSSGEYEVTVDDTNGCSQSLIVNVQQLNQSSLQLTGDQNQQICPGENTLLNVIANGGNPPYSYQWDNQVNTSSQNVSPSANTDYMVIVTDSDNCTDSLQFQVDLLSIPWLNLLGETEICHGSTGSVEVQTNATNYNWSTGETTESISPTIHSDSLISIEVSDQNGCINSDSILIHVLGNGVLAKFTCSPVDAEVFENIYFENLSINGNSYDWDFGDDNYSSDFEPVHQYQTIGDFPVELIVYDQYGCSDTARFEFISIGEPDGIFIPNAFTPDGNGENELFNLKGTNIQTITMMIFNRWGELIYEERGFDSIKGWNGKDPSGSFYQQGVYVYKLEVLTMDNEHIEKIGHVSLIR